MKLRAFVIVPILFTMVMVKACPAQAHTVLVKWTAPAPGPGITLTGFKIYRSTVTGAEGTTAYATVTGGATVSFIDSTVTPGATYFYKVSTTGTCNSTVVDCTGFATEGPQSAEAQTDKAIPLSLATPLGAPTAASAVVQ